MRDSFHVKAGEALHTLQVGELNVWVESSPLVTLPEVICGHAPYEFRTVLQSALENIHREQGAVLESFDGDASPLEWARPHLESCLQAQGRGAAKKNMARFAPLLLGGLALNSPMRRAAGVERERV